MAAPRRKPALVCPACGKRQFSTPSGVACENGHGGLEGVEAKPVSPTVRQTARRAAAHAIRGSVAWHKDVLVRAELSKIADRVLRGTPKDGQCCQWEDRDMNGGCRNCGDPCL